MTIWIYRHWPSMLCVSNNMEEYIRVDVVPEICKYYEKDIEKIKRCDVKSLGNMVNNWSSILYELELSFSEEEDENCYEEYYNLFVKSFLDDYQRRTTMQTVKQFSNEIHFYSTVKPILCEILPPGKKLFVQVPYMTMKSDIPKDSTDPRDGIMVMENLKLLDYKLGPRDFLDLQHCNVALRQLGRLHAASLVLKKLNPDQFHHDIVAPLQECHFTEECRDTIRSMYDAATERIYKNERYLNSPKARTAMKIYEEKCKDVFGYLQHLKESSTESEVALLCHGDFCRNNILYKYDENGKPVEAIPVDYQFARYGTPAHDLSIFLYMNTSLEIRRKYFMTMMRTYYQSLMKNMNEIILQAEGDVSPEFLLMIPSFDAILDDFRRYAVIGLTGAFFFTPRMICSKEDLTLMSEVSRDTTSKEYREAALNIGGDSVTKLLVEMFEDAIILDGLVI